MPYPKYDYVTDVLHQVDPALIDIVIEEAESYTRVQAEPLRQKLGKVAMQIIESLNLYYPQHTPPNE